MSKDLLSKQGDADMTPSAVITGLMYSLSCMNADLPLPLPKDVEPFSRALKGRGI
jgi:hypothetical protein